MSSVITETADKPGSSRIVGRPSRGLRAEHFHRIAAQGFGDRNNRTAHSMAWFRNHLYVGTTRRSEQDPYTSRPALDAKTRGQIWRFDPGGRRWEQVYVSPLIKVRGREVPRDVGYRGMVVFQGAGDGEPVLYVSTISDYGALFLRSADGVAFEEVSDPGLGNPANRSFRSFAVLGGRLYTSPAGRSGEHGVERNFADVPVIYEAANPASGRWHVVSKPGFGDPGNIGIFELATFNGCLYAGTFNPKVGCQVWKTSAQGEAPYQWIRVVSAGADKGNFNEVAVAMVPFAGALFVGTGVPGLGYDRAHGVGPAVAELFRVNGDDSWDLIVGEARDSGGGRKIPLSGLGAGFDNRFNSVIWRLVVHNGWLYAGTHDWSVFLPFFTRRMQRPLGRLWLQRTMQNQAGFDLWRSHDGVHWVEVTHDGFSTPSSYGVRTLVSTPFGLFIGTHSLSVASLVLDDRGGLRAGQSGGLDVWWGNEEGVSV